MKAGSDQTGTPRALVRPMRVDHRYIVAWHTDSARFMTTGKFVGRAYGKRIIDTGSSRVYIPPADIDNYVEVL